MANSISIELILIVSVHPKHICYWHMLCLARMFGLAFNNDPVDESKTSEAV